MENKNYGKRILHGTGSVWVSEEEIKIGIDYWLFNEATIVAPKNNSYDNMISEKMPLKIIAQTNLAIDGIAHIELPEEEDVEKLIIEEATKLGMYGGYAMKDFSPFKAGYKASSKDKKYSEEDMRKCWQLSHTQAVDIIKGSQDKHLSFEEYLQSLTPKSNDDIIGVELVTKEHLFPSEQDTIYYKENVTYLNKTGQTCFEVKQWHYK